MAATAPSPHRLPTSLLPASLLPAGLLGAGASGAQPPRSIAAPASARDGAAARGRAAATAPPPADLHQSPSISDELFGAPTWELGPGDRQLGPGDRQLGERSSLPPSRPLSQRDSRADSLHNSLRNSLAASPSWRAATGGAVSAEVSPESLALQQWLQMSGAAPIGAVSGGADDADEPSAVPTGAVPTTARCHPGSGADAPSAAARGGALPPPPPLRALHSVPLVSPRNGVRMGASPPPGNLVGLGRSINLATSS